VRVCTAACLVRVKDGEAVGVPQVPMLVDTEALSRAKAPWPSMAGRLMARDTLTVTCTSGGGVHTHRAMRAQPQHMSMTQGELDQPQACFQLSR
jgi:hypothetical protein